MFPLRRPVASASPTRTGAHPTTSSEKSKRDGTIASEKSERPASAEREKREKAKFGNVTNTIAAYGKKGSNIKREQRSADRTRIRSSNRKTLPVKESGAWFGGLRPIPINTTIDPAPYCCFNCWQPGHRVTHCNKGITRDFCGNCGRHGVEVTSCPRCAEAFRSHQQRGGGAVIPAPYSCFNCWQPGHGVTQCNKGITRDFCGNCGRHGVEVTSCPRCAEAFRSHQQRGGGYVPIETASGVGITDENWVPPDDQQREEQERRDHRQREEQEARERREREERCNKGITRDFCGNCGRHGVEVTSCPRCA
ncbi:hypothetical protein TSAR_001492 [Trichomalopsis sarcophagae]|uniref:CCHC-type domain-containing protein n=1 Tax=Trichomalopsis sarcophagae TaxID=543379 RepID=A0A232EDN0_9HYME|nr:hypothetical protein TSAR_001492 [Trichomalopsis sarcophagae]